MILVLIISPSKEGGVGMEGMERMAKEGKEGAQPRIFGTDPDNPEDGRIFIWTKMGWLERIEGSWGNVEFTPVADSEDDLRDWLARQDASVDLVELDDDYAHMVYDEFIEEEPLYPEAPENSSEPPFDEQNPD
jgi:hypothetical protein